MFPMALSEVKRTSCTSLEVTIINEFLHNL
jgi:hypothetical protein